MEWVLAVATADGHPQPEGDLGRLLVGELLVKGEELRDELLPDWALTDAL